MIQEMHHTFGAVSMAKRKNTPTVPQTAHSANNLAKRNQALLYALGGFTVLLYVVSFVRMGQW